VGPGVVGQRMARRAPQRQHAHRVRLALFLHPVDEAVDRTRPRVVEGGQQAAGDVHAANAGRQGAVGGQVVEGQGHLHRRGGLGRAHRRRGEGQRRDPARPKPARVARRPSSPRCPCVLPLHSLANDNGNSYAALRPRRKDVRRLSSDPIRSFPVLEWIGFKSRPSRRRPGPRFRSGVDDWKSPELMASASKPFHPDPGLRRDERTCGGPVLKHRTLAASIAWLAFATPALAQTATPQTPAPKANEILSPADTYGDLFRQVQMRQLFPDGKTFVDAAPKRPPARILADYRLHAAFTDAELKRFVTANFDVPESAPSATAVPGPNHAEGSHRRPVAGADPPAGQGRGWRQRPAVGQAVRRARRALSRDVLLGQLFHDAGPGRRRPAGRGREHGRRFRRADRPLWPHPQRHAHLLSQPLAAAVLLRDGGPRQRRRGRQDRQGAIQDPPGPDAARARLLDGRREGPQARPGAPPRRRPARRRDPQPLRR
jgi:hypothetical protein